MSGERTIHAKDERKVTIMHKWICGENCRAAFLCENNTELVLHPQNGELLAQVKALFAGAGHGFVFAVHAKYYDTHEYKCTMEVPGAPALPGGNVCQFTAVKNVAAAILTSAKCDEKVPATTLKFAVDLDAICQQFVCSGNHRAPRVDQVPFGFKPTMNAN